MSTDALNEKKGSSLAFRSLKRLMKNRLAMAGGVTLLALIVLCAAAPLLTSHDPLSVNVSMKMAGPSGEYIMGADAIGRDLWSRVLYGGQISIAIALTCAILTHAIGTMLGCVCGFFQGKTDTILMTLGEVISCFPQRILILIIMGFFAQNVLVMIAVMTLTSWAGTMRVVRAKVLSLKAEPYIESLRANGISNFSIMFRHMLPNTMGLVIIGVTGSVGGFVLTEAALSFLGLGVPKGIPTWGNMLNAANSLTIILSSTAVWLVPCVAISLFVLSSNFLGDGLRDAFDVTSN